MGKIEGIPSLPAAEEVNKIAYAPAGAVRGYAAVVAGANLSDPNVLAVFQSATPALGLVLNVGDQIFFARIDTAIADVDTTKLPPATFARRKAATAPTAYALIFHDGTWKKMRWAEFAQPISEARVIDDVQRAAVKKIVDDTTIYKMTNDPKSTYDALINKKLEVMHAVRKAKVSTSSNAIELNFYGFKVV